MCCFANPATSAFCTPPTELRPKRDSGNRATTREGYALARRQELLAALEVFGIGPDQQATLPFGDRELPRHLVALTEHIRQQLILHRPHVVYTHPFEGGHPDHDSTTYAVHRAVALLKAAGQPPPELREFLGYHARNGEFYCGSFLQDTPVETIVLSDAEVDRKRRALDCHRSQQRVIQRFPLNPQRWRRAPAYSFDRRPHEGPLYYEIREMGYRFEDFACLVREADAALTC
jgi:LmbE family N-acetylglucosaminyl deacetylase